jgi:hypothetical protein
MDVLAEGLIAAIVNPAPAIVRSLANGVAASNNKMAGV